jgi:iron complex outermembrane recepter protein
MPLSRRSHRLLLPSLAVLAATCQSSPLLAEDIIEDVEQKTEIVVTAERIRGSIDTKVPPIEEINEADIASYGASSLTDLIAAVAPQTGSGRGRGGGMPIILLNGQRVSGFRELRDLPPEAIKRVQIFPEEVALQYGYRPDQRVINIILKDGYSAFNVELETGTPENGGYRSDQFENNFTTISKSSRININAEYQHTGRLTEDKRDIINSSGGAPFALLGNITGLGAGGEIDPALSARAGRVLTSVAVPGTANPTLTNFAANSNTLNSGDIGGYRTLLPRTDRFEINGTWSRSLAPQTNISLNGNFRADGSTSLLGLPSASFVLPATSPFTPFTRDVVLNRYFTSPVPLERDTQTNSAKFGFSFNSLLAGWRWGLTGDYSHIKSQSITTRNDDFTSLRAAVLAGTANPFAADFGRDLYFLAPDLTRSLNQTLTVLNTFNGTAFELPAGRVQMTLRTGYEYQALDSQSTRSAVITGVALQRNNFNASLNIEIPLIEASVGALGFLGEVALNANYGLNDLSDFGSLTEYGVGLRWKPAKSLTFQISLIGDENAPTITALGNPNQLTPNVAFYDFTNNQTRFVTILSGGNPALLGENRRDWKLSANWSPTFIKDFGLQIEYFRNDSMNTTVSFPLLTPAIEAAFAARVTRDSSGQLLSIDQRPVNFERERSQRIRWGFNVSGGIGPQQQGGGPFAGLPRGGGGPPPGAGQGGSGQSGAGQGGAGQGGGGPRQGAGQGGGPRGGPGGGGGGGGGPPMFGGGQGGRWQLALYHTWRLQDDVLIRSGLPLLDLLNGGATNSQGGSSVHELELSGGMFYKGVGLRVMGNYRSATRVDGSSLPGSSDLRFSDLATLGTMTFLNFDAMGKLAKKVPVLKGARLALRIDNILNDVIDVRDQNGRVPLSYQPGYLDPKGRYFELSFRKRF